MTGGDPQAEAARAEFERRQQEERSLEIRKTCAPGRAGFIAPRLFL